MSDQYKTRQTLIQRIKDNQNEQSWEEFLRTYQPYIRAIVRNMNIAEHDAEDLVQQVMLKVWKNISELENDPNKSHYNRTGFPWSCEHLENNYSNRWHTFVDGDKNNYDASISVQGFLVGTTTTLKDSVGYWRTREFPVSISMASGMTGKL